MTKQPEVKATPGRPFEGRPTWHGKFYANGKWHTVVNADNLPIIYTTSDYACAAARHVLSLWTDHPSIAFREPDTSDIPEAGEEFFKRAKLKRPD